MKILQIIYTLSQGGAERFIVDLCNEIAKESSNEIHLLTVNASIVENRHYLDSLSKNVYYHDVGALKGLSIRSIWGVYKSIKVIQPDIVHIHCSPILIYFPSLFYRKAKYVHTLHSLADKAISFKWLKCIQKVLFRKYIQPITISNICQESYIDFYKQSNAIRITNGRAVLEMTSEYETVKEEIEKYKHGKNLPVFVHVARFSKEKNQKLLFDTFERLHNEGKPFLLVVLGANYEKSPYMYLNDTSYIKILGVKQNVGDYLACADYFVLSSLYEGLPLSLLEAMSMGCIPICTPAGGVLDVIKDGINGLVCPSFENEDYYKTISRVFTKDFLINKTDIVRDYMEKYTMEACVKEYYKVYEHLLSNSTK